MWVTAGHPAVQDRRGRWRLRLPHRSSAPRRVDPGPRALQSLCHELLQCAAWHLTQQGPGQIDQTCAAIERTQVDLCTQRVEQEVGKWRQPCGILKYPGTFFAYQR